MDYDIKVGVIPYGTAVEYVRNILSLGDIHTAEELQRISVLQLDSMSGKSGAKEALIAIIKEKLDQFSIDVRDMSREKVAEEIFKESWGLGPIEDIYNSPDVDEIHVIGPKIVYSIRRGVPRKENVHFPSPKALEDLATRLLRSDTAINERNPIVRSVREDGTRVVATGPPGSRHLTLSLRKHGTFVVTKESLVKSGTMDEKTYEKIALFSEARLNVLLSGPVNSGKTTDIRHFFGYSRPELRTVVIEPDSELRLLEHYPDWNIIEFEEHRKLGLDMEVLFETTLQLSPVRIIIGEILGIKELRSAVKAGVRGQTGNFSTYHSRSIVQALHNLALTYTQEFPSASMNVDMAMSWIVQAFDIIIQLWTNPELGIKKVIHIAEPYIGEDGRLALNDIVKWRGSSEGYHVGEYEHFPISPRLRETMFMNGMPLSKIEKWC